MARPPKRSATSSSNKARQASPPSTEPPSPSSNSSRTSTKASLSSQESTELTEAQLEATDSGISTPENSSSPHTPSQEYESTPPQIKGKSDADHAREAIRLSNPNSKDWRTASVTWFDEESLTALSKKVGDSVNTEQTENEGHKKNKFKSQSPQAKDSLPFSSVDDLILVETPGKTTELNTTEVQGTVTTQAIPSDTQFLLQMLYDQHRDIDLEDIMFADSCTSISPSADANPVPCDVPVSTIVDFFPSNIEVQKRLLRFVGYAGPTSLRNIALSNPEDLSYKQKYIREARDVTRVSKFFMVGVLMAFRLSEEGRGKQICMAPVGATFARAIAVLASLFRVSELGIYSFMNGISYSTLLAPDTKSGNSANLLSAPPKKKFKTSPPKLAPSVLQYTDKVPVYDGRHCDFQPEEYEKLPLFTEEIPPSACTMTIFTANSTAPKNKYLSDNNMQGYPIYASFNILAVVYLQEPDVNKRQVNFNRTTDTIGVSFPGPLSTEEVD